MRLFLLLFGLTVFLSFSKSLHAQWQINEINEHYQINFQETIPGVINGQFQGLGFSADPTEGQLNSNAWSVTGLSDGDMDFGGEGTSGSFAMGMADAGVDAPGIYAHPGSGNIAKLMFQPSDDDLTPGSLILKMHNNTGRHIDYIYYGFNYYQFNDQDGSNKITFQVSDDAMDSWTDEWFRTTPGNAPANPNITSSTIRGYKSVSVMPGEYVYFRWYFEDAGGGEGHDEMFIDNIGVIFLDTGGYCIPQFSSVTAGAGITYFSLNNITNTSDIGLIAYSDFTSKVINVIAGDSYSLSFRTGSNFANRSPKAGIYVDWDQDGNFDGPDDDMFGAYSFTGMGTHTLNFTVPEDAAHGDTRLRIVVVRDSHNTLAPCVTTVVWGEAEDYTLRVHPAGTCFEPSDVKLQTYYEELIQMQWTPGGNQTGWRVEAGDPGFIPGTDSEIISYNSTGWLYNTISGFTRGTQYDVYVQSSCGEDGSEWVGPLNFYTPLKNFMAQAVEEFTDVDDISWLSIPADGWQPHNNSIQSQDEGHWLVSPPVDLSFNHFVRWEVANAQASAANTYRLWLNNSGYINPENFDILLGEYVVTSDEWIEEVVNLSAYHSQRVFLAFEHIGVDGGSVPLRLDNIAIVTNVCDPVTAIEVDAIQAHQADISWLTGNNGQEWLVEVGFEDFTPGVGEQYWTDIISGDPQITVTDLLDNTTYHVYVKNLCGYSGASEWTGPIGFTTLCSIETPEYFADFTGNALPSCWWRGKSSYYMPEQIQQFFSAWFFGGDAAFVNFTDRRNDYLVSKAIDLGDGSKNYQLEFDVRMRSIYSERPKEFYPGESFQVRLSSNIDYLSGETVFFHESNKVLERNQSEPLTWEWERVVIDLSAFTGTYMIGFYAESPNFSNQSSETRVIINNIRIREIPQCKEPLNPSIGEITSNSVTFGWDNQDEVPQVEIEYGAVGFIQGTGTLLSYSEYPAVIDGLPENTAFEAWFRTVCDGDFSEWRGPVFFRTTGKGNNCSDPIVVTIPGDAPYSDLDQSTRGRGNDYYFDTCIGIHYQNGEEIIYELNITQTSVIRILIEANIGLLSMALMEQCPQNTGCLVSLYTTGTSIDRKDIFLNPGTYYLLIARSPEPTYIPRFDLHIEVMECGAPTNALADEIDSNSVMLSWEHTEGQESFNIEAAKSAFTPGTGNALLSFYDIGTPPYLVEGLDPATPYVYYIQANCGEEQSSWRGPFLMVTLPECTQPANVQVSNLTHQGADISWDFQDGAVSWQLEIGEPGFVPGTGNEGSSYEVTETAFQKVEGLNPNTTWDFYIKTECGYDTSGWSEKGTFTTLCHDVVVDLGGDQSVCPDDLPVVLDAGSGFVSYQWSEDELEGHQVSISEAGTYSVTVTDEFGCTGFDEVVIIVHPVYTTSLSEELCEGDVYNFFGTLLNESGVYTHTLSSVNDCDSIIELTLTVHPVYTTSIAEELCEGDVYDFFGTLLSESGVYTHTLSSINNCDSIIELTLTVHSVYSTSISEELCEGDVYDFFGTLLSESGIYTHTLASINDCDSIIELILTVHPVYTTSIAEELCEGDVYDFFGTLLGESGVYTHTLASINNCDSIIELTLTVHQVYTTSISEELCEGEVYDFYGTLLNESGIYTHTLASINNCDSIIELTLTVHPVYTTLIAEELCEGDVYDFFGTLLSESGFYTHTLSSVNECDSIIELTLTVHPVYITSISEELCEGDVYDFFGTLLNESGVYTHTLASINNCDSIIELTLTVHPVYTTSIAEELCEGEVYDFFGNLLNESGVYTHTLSSINNCDSIIELTLTVHPVYTTSIAEELCEGEVYDFFGNLLNESGVYTHTLSSINNCDSIIELTLTVHQVYTTSISEELCEGDVYDFFGTLLSESGVYTHTLSSVNDCDSIIELTLTVHPMPEKPTITVEGETLVSSSSEGNQWYLNGSSIDGATGMNFIPQETGWYSVSVTLNNCTGETSEPVYFNWMNLDKLLFRDLLVFPNPSRGMITVEGIRKETKVYVYNLRGELLDSFIRNEDFNYDLGLFSPGIYMLRFISGGQGRSILIEKR